MVKQIADEVKTENSQGPMPVDKELDGDRLLVFDLADQKWSELGKAAIGFLMWSPDSKFVYFDNGFNPEQAISCTGFRPQDRAGRESERLSKGCGSVEYLVWTGAGRFSSYNARRRDPGSLRTQLRLLAHRIRILQNAKTEYARLECKQGSATWLLAKNLDFRNQAISHDYSLQEGRVL